MSVVEQSGPDGVQPRESAAAANATAPSQATAAKRKSFALMARARQTDRRARMTVLVRIFSQKGGWYYILRYLYIYAVVVCAYI